MEVTRIQEQYNQLRGKILEPAIGLLKSFSTLELKEVTNQIENKSPIVLTEEDKTFIHRTLVSHFNDWCVTRKEAEAKKTIDEIEPVTVQIEGLTEQGTEKVVKRIQKNLIALQKCIYQLYQPENTSAYNDFTSRSTEEIISYFDQSGRLEFFQLTNFKKEIEKLLNSYLSKFDDSYHQIYRQYFFELDKEIQDYLKENKKGRKSGGKRIQKVSSRKTNSVS